MVRLECGAAASWPNLPHYEIPGAIYFVTFRLADSLPAEVYAKLAARREAFLRQNAVPHSDEQERALRRIFSVPLERCLDQGFGQCVLRHPEAQRLLEQILRHFDGERYQLGDYVIMPNHVHLLMRMRQGLSARTQCRNWKTLSAREINRLVARHGPLWQSEPFDHIVRSPAKLQQCREYIRNNPRNLPPGAFTSGEGMGFESGQLRIGVAGRPQGAAAHAGIEGAEAR